MTADGGGTPENDDPFGYLYRSEGGAPTASAEGGPRTPRTSYHQVQRVGERRQAYPQSRPHGQPQGYGHPPAHGDPQRTGADRTPPPGGGHRSASGGGMRSGPDNRKGLLIGAVAVVAAVAIGIAFAMTNGSGDDPQAGGKSRQTTAPPTTAGTPSTSATPSAEPALFDSKPVDAATLALTGGAQTSTQYPGASAAGGTYVTAAQPGAAATWTVTVPEDGAYTFFVSYGNAGPDATLSLAVNGTPRTDPVKLKNYGAYTDWSKSWRTTTYSYVDLKKGANTLQVSCQAGDQCQVALDQVWLKQGQVKK